MRVSFVAMLVACFGLVEISTALSQQPQQRDESDIEKAWPNCFKDRRNEPYKLLGREHERMKTGTEPMSCRDAAAMKVFRGMQIEYERPTPALEKVFVVKSFVVEINKNEDGKIPGFNVVSKSKTGNTICILHFADPGPKYPQRIEYLCSWKAKREPRNEGGADEPGVMW
jgi:hypothetical protein